MKKLIPFLPRPKRGIICGKYVICKDYSANKKARAWLTKKGFSLCNTANENVWLSHGSPLRPQGGQIVLIPGNTNAYGLGVYLSTVGGNIGFISDGEFRIYRPHLEALAKKNLVQVTSTWFVLKGAIKLSVGHVDLSNPKAPIFYCLVKEMIEEKAAHFLTAAVFVDKTVQNTKAKTVCAAREAIKPSNCQGATWRIAGVGLALGAYGVGAWKLLKNKDATGHKWLALGRFLLGIRGSRLAKRVGFNKVKISKKIASSWRSGVFTPNGEHKYYIRPNAKTALFWLVGGMTIEQTDTGWYGEDVYDFHVQKGQNTIIGKPMWCWAWSGGLDDPTQIPSKTKVFNIEINLFNMALRLLGKKARRYLKLNDNNNIEFSNDFWNALGGKPYKHVLEVTERGDKTN